MRTTETSRRAGSLLAAVGGPVVLGAALGVPFGVRAILTESVLLPGLVLGLTLMMAPALYIGLSLAGVAPPASQVGTSVGHALRASGLVMAGLAPAMAFLLATTLSHAFVCVLGLLAVGGAVAAGLRALWADLVSEPARRLRAIPVFGLWCMVSLGLGAQLFIHMIGA